MKYDKKRKNNTFSFIDDDNRFRYNGSYRSHIQITQFQLMAFNVYGHILCVSSALTDDAYQ